MAGADYPRDEFPLERWRGQVDQRLAGHDRELKAVRELIASLVYSQDKTRDELGSKIDHVAEEASGVRVEVAGLKRFLLGIAAVVGFAAPLLVSLIARFA